MVFNSTSYEVMIGLIQFIFKVYKENETNYFKYTVTNIYFLLIFRLYHKL